MTDEFDLNRLKKEWAQRAFSYSNAYQKIDRLLIEGHIRQPWLVNLLDDTLEQMKNFYAESEVSIDQLIQLVTVMQLRNNMLIEMIEESASQDQELLMKIIRYAPGKKI